MVTMPFLTKKLTSRFWNSWSDVLNRCTCPAVKESKIGSKSSGANQSLESAYPSITRVPIGVTKSGSRRDSAIAICLLFDHSNRSEEHTSELQSRQYLVCR